MADSRESSKITTALYAEVQDRFGVLPNFFRLASDSPEIMQNFWGFAKVGYLDNPLPSLFKERLFVYMSRFCEIRYCIARHVGFLIGLGRPAGNSHCRTQTVDETIRLIRRPLPRGDELQPHIKSLEASPSPLPLPPETESPLEEAVFACATHVFLQTQQSTLCLDALRQAFEEGMLQHLLVFLSFVRTAHFWTKVHPELDFEEDIKELFAIHEELAECVLRDCEAEPNEATQGLLDELGILRRERALWEEIERANEALREADRRKNEFLATLAHELRNPLAPISTGLELLKMVGDDSTTLEEIRHTMEQQTQQLIRLIDDLLDVSRITTGKLQLRKCQVELADILQSALDATRCFFDKANQELTLEFPKYPIFLNADPHRLAQVFSNLLNNASKYTPEGGHVRLTCEPGDQDVVIVVQDDGVGIPSEKQAQIFQMFSQIDHPLDRTHQGLGVGLSLVKTLVEMHDGTIRAHSDGGNRGSEFRVHLPILPERPEESAEGRADEAKTEGKRHRALVVDDNKAAAEMLGRMVKILGKDVRIANDGQQAIEVAAEFLPDIILMDIGMPKMNGYEAAKHIRQQAWGEQMVLVALTGWGQEEDKQQANEAGFDHHLVKPADSSDLKKLLEELDRNPAQ